MLNSSFCRGYLLGAFLFSLGCTSVQEIKKEKFTMCMPVVHFDSSIELYSQDFAIVNFRNLVLYELPYRASLQQDDKLIYDSIFYEFFIFKKGQTSGYLFRSLQDSIGPKLKVDSVLGGRALYNFTFDSLLVLKNYPSVQRDINENELCVHYPKNEFDSINIYLNKKLRNINISLSPKIDSVYKSKLFKIEIWEKNRYDKGGNPSLKTTFTIEKEVINHPNELRDFLTKARNRFLQ